VDVAEPVAVLGALQLADELSAAGSQAGDGGADVLDGECGEWNRQLESSATQRPSTDPSPCSTSPSWRVMCSMVRNSHINSA
jgi:hypothetical protein